MAAPAASSSSAAVLREDDRGIPRSLPLLAALVEAEARLHAAVAAATRPGGTSSLVRAFRGGAAPAVPIREFLERIHLAVRSVPSTGGVVRIDGACFVLAGIYLTRFAYSAAAREAGVRVDPATAHRLVASSLFLGAKFGGHPPRRWADVFESSSGGAIRAGEMADLEGRFLRAISFRLFVDGERFESFSGALEQGPQRTAGAGAAPPRRGVLTRRPEMRTSAAASGSGLACRHLSSRPIKIGSDCP